MKTKWYNLNSLLQLTFRDYLTDAWLPCFAWEIAGLLLVRIRKSTHLVMSGCDWLFFTMQFASNGRQTDDASETEPILTQSTGTSSSKEPLSLWEIRPVNTDASDDRQSIDANEHCSLVNAEQPQCRICFDSEGYFLAQLVYYFPPGICSWVCFTYTVILNRIVFHVGEDLIAPCYCRGTQKYVHRSCLDNWRSTKVWFGLIIDSSLCGDGTDWIGFHILRKWYCHLAYAQLCIICMYINVPIIMLILLQLQKAGLFILFLNSLSGRFCLFTLYRVQGCVPVACKCAARPLVVETEVSVSCCQRPHAHIYYCATGEILSSNILLLFYLIIYWSTVYKQNPNWLISVLIS